MRKFVVLGAATLFAACGGDGSIDLASASPFCQQVLPTVAAFISDAEAARPTPSDDRYGGTVVVGGRAELAGGMNAAGNMDYAALQHQQYVLLMTLLEFTGNRRVALRSKEATATTKENHHCGFSRGVLYVSESQRRGKRLHMLSGSGLGEIQISVSQIV